MAFYYDNRDRPGVHPIVVSLRGVPASGSSSGGSGGGGGGGGAAAATLYVTPEGVLVSTGAAPKMDGNTLVYTPTPVMTENVMAIS